LRRPKRTDWTQPGPGTDEGKKKRRIPGNTEKRIKAARENQAVTVSKGLRLRPNKLDRAEPETRSRC